LAPPCYFFTPHQLRIIGKDSILQEVLSNAGLSGPGLTKLCAQPLDPQTVRAVVLYAGANELGPGYIYQHLANGAPVDPLFLDLAALDEPLLETFQEAVAELDTAGTLSRETQAGIPPDQVELFARYAGAVAGFEVEGVVAMFRRGEEVVVDWEPEPAQEKDAQDQLWERVKERLRGQMSQAAFVTRVKNTWLRDRQGNRFTIAAPDPLSRDWLANRFAELIRRALASVLGEGAVELEFVV